jgi:hypothetical protein
LRLLPLLLRLSCVCASMTEEEEAAAAGLGEASEEVDWLPKLRVV